VTVPVTAFFLLGIVNIIFYKKLLGNEDGPKRFARQMRTLIDQAGSSIEQTAENMLTAVSWEVCVLISKLSEWQMEREQTVDRMLMAVVWKVYVLFTKLPEWQMGMGTVAGQRPGRRSTSQMEAGTN
jgi:hypothetical protein